MTPWIRRHLDASLQALGDLPEPFVAFLDRPEAAPVDAPDGTWKVLVEDGPLGRGAVVLDTWEGDALAGSIIRLEAALPHPYNLDAAGRVHLGISGRFVRAFGFLLGDGPPILRFELREREPGAGICTVATLMTRQRDLDRDRRAEVLAPHAAETVHRVEVWIPAGGSPWLGVVLADRRIVDAPTGAWTAEPVEGSYEAWAVPGGVQRVQALRGS